MLGVHLKLGGHQGYRHQAAMEDVLAGRIQCTEAAAGIHGALPPMPSRQKGNIDRKRQVARVDFRNGSTAGLSKFYGMYRFSRPVSLDQSG